MAGKHLADATLIGFLDGELPGWSARTAAHHMAICSACRERMAELEEELALLNRNAQVNSISSKRIRCWQIGFATRVRVYEEKYHRS